MSRRERSVHWLNFGSGWSHLHNDDPAQMLSGASQRLFYNTATAQWKLAVEATMFVTYEVVVDWSGVKAGGNDPVGVYTRVGGCDTTETFTIKAAL